MSALARMYILVRTKNSAVYKNIKYAKWTVNVFG